MSDAPHRETAILDVAQRLEAEGWSVRIQPGSSEVPEELSGFRPDYVAYRGDQVLIGEVKYRRSANEDNLRELTLRVSLMANARLEVTLLGDEPPALPPVDYIRRVAGQAREIFRTSPEAALLLAWSAFEGASARLASTSFNQSLREPAKRRLSNLYSLGVLSKRQFDLLTQAQEARNQIAHAYGGVAAESSLVLYVSRLAEYMTSDSYLPIDQMVDWFLERYEDPVNRLPYVTADGGYLYATGEPYDPYEVLSQEFNGAPEEDLHEVAEIVSATSNEWVSKVQSTE